MKVLSLALATLALSACGTQKQESSDVSGFPGFNPQYVEANNFMCDVEQNFSAYYSTSSRSGVPTFGVHSRADENLFGDLSVMGEQIDFGSQEDGTTLVSGRHAIPDFKVTTWTLAVPQILLGKNENVRAFETTLTILEEPTSIMGPLPGQKSTTTILKAKCEASAVNF